MPSTSRIYATGLLPGRGFLMATLETRRAHQLARRVTDDPRTTPGTTLEIHTPGQPPIVYRRQPAEVRHA